jgi:lambda family phage tail tape measure protein
MANEELRVKIAAQVQGLDQIESLKNAVRQLQNSATPAAADLQKLKNAAMQLGSATNRTESDLRKSIGALRDVKSQLSITDAEYKKLTNTINKYQAQLDKATGAQQRQGRGMQFAQTAGAVAASGVFGGPEGLVGAGIGAFFGPGGALAGGAIGAQVSGIRQQLGGTATLAADLEKQRTALRLVLKDSAEYNASLQFLSKTSREYAIPQDRLVKGFTQLAASVAGAGGNINDTKTAFQGIAAGIRGTGGSLENLDAALLATSQVFSKGKVSAEELRGQIGERLPGAFTLFAQSIGKTPQELDKALERGEVTLQDFLSFSKTLFGEYGENAKIIADSPAAAGDRLQTNLKNLSETVGKLLQPVGAAFQNTFSEIVKYIDVAATRLANFLGMNKTNVEKVGELNNIIIIQQRAIQRERNKLAAGTTSKESAAYNITEFEARVATAQGELKVIKALNKATEQQSKTPKPGLGAAGSLADDAASKQAADKAAKDAAALATEQQRLAETVMQQRLRIEDTLFKHQVELDRKRYDLQKQLNDQQTQNRIAAETGLQRSVTADFEQLKQRLREITERQAQANDRVRLAEQALKTASAMASVTTGGPSAGMAGIYRQGSIGPTSTGPHFDIKRSDGGFYGRTALDKYVSVNGRPLSSGVTVPGGEYGARRSYGGHAGRDYAFGAGAGLSLMGGAQWVGNRPGTAHGDETAFRTPDGKVYKILHGKFEQAGVAAQQRRGVKAEGTAGLESIDLQAAQRERQLEKEFEAPQRQEAMISFILQQTDAIREQNATMQNSIELEVKRASLLGQGYGPERIESMMKVAELEQLRSQRVAKLGELARSNPEMTGELTTAIGEVNAEYTNLIATIERLYEIQSSPQARLQQAVGAVRQELTALTDPVNQIVGAANAIGSSFGSAFKGLVSGSMSAKEALASFFQSTADYFLDMASKIITQWITMTILNSALKLFPGGAGAAGGGLAGSSLPGGFANPLVGAYTNANGNAFAANGIVPYAKGGIVDRPTMFKFAKGGAMQTGIMGEAGAEAVMPLKRGPDGKLGVAATGGGGVNVVVNVDAKGSAVQGDQGQGNELGRVIAGAVQAELIKQQRPGGLLTR